MAGDLTAGLIKNALSRRLGILFPNLSVYIDPITQNTPSNYFFVSILNKSQKQIMGNLWERMYFTKIEYFPLKTNPLRLSDIAEKEEVLLDGLRYISVNVANPPPTELSVKSLDVDSQTVGEVLQVFASYRIRMVDDLVPLPQMEDQEFTTEIIEGE